MLAIACTAASKSAQTTSAAEGSCTADGLIHAEVSRAVTGHVAGLVNPTSDGTRLREAARLTLPCGFTLDTRWVPHVILTDGTETRQYAENNPFGFAVPFGFSKRVTRPYTLRHLPEPYRLQAKASAQDLERPAETAPICSTFRQHGRRPGRDGADVSLLSPILQPSRELPTHSIRYARHVPVK